MAEGFSPCTNWTSIVFLLCGRFPVASTASNGPWAGTYVHLRSFTMVRHMRESNVKKF